MELSVFRMVAFFCHLFGFKRDISGSMMTTRTMPAVENSDAELVSRSLTGDRDAFSQIVTRYQNLICSIAYSAMGNLGQSEDVAQETFITAWRRLGHLREPAKLRAWLCGIVRNRIQKSLHREGREPASVGEPLEAVDESPAHEALPSDQTISREEEAILWRSLEKIPEAYREPLVLFYREHQSIKNVAAVLELSEDAVKQRLSRGRKLLQEQVQTFVENTLSRTAPDEAFSAAVLAALPLVAGSAATTGVGVAGKSTAAAKSGFLGAWLAPFIGIVGGIMAHWLIVRAAPTARERRIKKIAFIGLWTFVLVWCVAGQLAVRALSQHFNWSDQIFFAVMAGFWWFYAIVVATLSIVMFRKILAVRRQSEESEEVPQTNKAPLKVSTRIAVVAGLYLACFWWLIDLAWEANDTVSVGIITAAMLVLAVWNFLQVRNKAGVVAMRTVIEHLALIWAVILLILNWRLEVWEASLHGIDLAEMHRLLPAWIVYLLTAALLVWMGILVAATKPRLAGITQENQAA